jgi:hypothetical protein
MSGSLVLVVAAPLLLSATSALLPARATAMQVAAAGLVGALVTLCVAIWAFRGPATAPDGFWCDDPVSRTLSLFAAMAWALTALHICAMRLDLARGQARRWPVAAQLAVGSVMALCRADLLMLLPIGFALLLSATGRLEGGVWRSGAQTLAPVMAMGFGALLLSGRLGVPARWSLVMPDDGLAPPLGVLLLVLPSLFMALAASLRASDDQHAGARQGVLRCLVPLLFVLPTSALVLRAGPSVGRPVMLIGLVLIGLSVALMASRRTLPQRVALSASIQFGAAMLGLGAGGPGGIASALMLVGFACLLLPVALIPSPSPAVGRLAMLAVIGMPPFGPFSAGLLLLIRLFALSAPVALLMLVGFTAAAGGFVSARARNWGTSAPLAVAWVIPGVVAIAMTAWLGLSMPGKVSEWLLTMAAPGGTGHVDRP